MKTSAAERLTPHEQCNRTQPQWLNKIIDDLTPDNASEVRNIILRILSVIETGIQRKEDIRDCLLTLDFIIGKNFRYYLLKHIGIIAFDNGYVTSNTIQREPRKKPISGIIRETTNNILSALAEKECCE
ncbi:MAG: hypothetical protein ABIH78_01585 [Candidatus Peregrinibacteria bacterium]